MTALALSFVLAIASCAGLILAGKGMWQGWAVGVFVQPVWAAFAIITGAYGLIIISVMYAIVYGHNWYKWKSD